jgi:hypothetical protein
VVIEEGLMRLRGGKKGVEGLEGIEGVEGRK